MFVNTADSLLTALFSIGVLVLVKRREIKHFNFFILTLVLLTSFTRFSLFIWVAIACTLFIQKSRRIGVSIALMAIAAFMPILFVDFSRSVLASESSLPLTTKILHFPLTCLRIAFYEVSQLVVLDRYLILFLVIVTVVALMHIRSPSSCYFLSVLFSLWLTGAINGVVGVNFRYQLPLLPFAAWVILESSESFLVKMRTYFAPKLR
jgi:hypothetical protein